MRLRAALAAGALMAALATAPAAAQDAKPVVGAGSFSTAPILEPGTYRDTVLPEEYLYYGVRVAPGQRLRVTLQAGLTGREMADLGLVAVQVNLHAPDRELLYNTSGRASTPGADEERVDVVTTAARTSEEARTSISEAWEGAGVYFVAVYAIFAGSGGPRRPRCRSRSRSPRGPGPARADADGHAVSLPDA